MLSTGRAAGVPILALIVFTMPRPTASACLSSAEYFQRVNSNDESRTSEIASTRNLNVGNWCAVLIQPANHHNSTLQFERDNEDLGNIAS